MRLRNLLLVACLAGSGVLAETFELTLEPGWNLVSVPIALDNPSPAAVFQGVDARIVWRYDAEAGMYAVADRLEPGQGYWVYVGPPDGRGGRSTATVNGTAVRAATLPLRQGWHLVGPVGFAPYAALPAPLQIGPGSGVDGEVVGWAGGVYRRLAELPAGAAAWMFSAGDGEIRLSPNPTFAGPVMAYSPEVGQARVHWPEASDDRTAPEAMRYRVYAALVGRGELVDNANLAATVVGATFAVLDGLLPGETYRVTVVAEDEAGNRNYFNRTVLTVPVMEVANILDQAPRDLAAEGLTVNDVSLDGATVTVADAGTLVVDDIIVFDNPNGTGLRRIVALNVTRNGNFEIVTEEATLAQVIDTGVLRSSLVVSDMGAVAPNRATRDGTLEYLDPAGAFRLTRQTGEYGAAGQRSSREEVGVIGGRYTGTADLGHGLSVGYGIGFKPSIDTEARFEFLSLKYCRIVATGEFSLDARAGYNLTGALNVNRKRKLFGVSHRFTYAIGPCPLCLPVWQDVGLDFYVEMNVTAQGALNIEAVYSAAKTVQIGFVYDNGEWSMVSSDGFTQELTFDVHAEGTLLATVKVYPVLWTKFYSSLAGQLYVEPTLCLDSHVRFVPPPVEMTKFDGNFFVDAYVTAGLEIFGTPIGDPWESPSWTMLDTDLFSLPEVAFAAAPGNVAVDQPATFTLDIQAGLNNPVPAANIQWWVESDGRGLPAISLSADRRTATVTAREEGTYTLWVSVYGSGWGALNIGTVGKRYASTVFTASQGLGDDFVLIPGGTNSGTNPLASGESYDPSWYPQNYSLTVSSFYMGQCEVTWGQWQTVRTWAAANGYDIGGVGGGKGANHPVHSVNWYDVVKWCNARSQMEGRTPCYTVSGAVYRTGQHDNVNCNFSANTRSTAVPPTATGAARTPAGAASASGFAPRPQGSRGSSAPVS